MILREETAGREASELAAVKVNLLALDFLHMPIPQSSEFGLPVSAAHKAIKFLEEEEHTL